MKPGSRRVGRDPFLISYGYADRAGRTIVTLALCPTCAAKWRHANAATPETLADAINEAEGTEIVVTLAGSSVRLRFVDVHFQDLKTVLAASLPGQPITGTTRLETQASGAAFAIEL